MRLNLPPWVEKHFWLLVLLGTWGVYFAVLGTKLLYFSPQGDLVAGHLNVWSDWSLHVAMARIFETKSPSEWFAYHPVYAEGRLTYPFLANMIPGLLMRTGMSVVTAFRIPTILTFLALLVGGHRLLSLLLKSQSKAYLALSLFFLSSGMGFTDYLSQLLESPSWDKLFFPPKEYGRIDELSWFASNFITGMLLPQRAFPLGMAFSLWSLYLLFSVEKCNTDAARHAQLVGAGILTGLLPITHAHSFIFILVVAGLYCALQREGAKSLLYYVVPAGLLSTSLYFAFVAGGIENRSFMSIVPGFVARSFGQWVGFWAKVWGYMIPVAIYGIWRNRREWSLAAQVFFLGSAGFFVLANLIQFQPIQWDNSKLFLWSYFGLSAVAAEVLHQIWTQTIFNRRLARFAAALLFVVLTATGWTEIVRLQSSRQGAWHMLSADDRALAEKVRLETSSQARFLTETSHNHWAMFWAARPIMMGYTAWVLNFGFNYWSLESHLKKMYAGGEEGLALLRQHSVSYVVIGPGEERLFKPNESYFREHFPLAFKNRSYRVYDIRNERR